MAYCGGGVPDPEPVTHVPFAWGTYAIEIGGGDWEYRLSSDGQHRVPWGWQNESKSDWQVRNCVEEVGRKYSIHVSVEIVLHVTAICAGQGPRVSFVLPHHG